MPLLRASLLAAGGCRLRTHVCAWVHASGSDDMPHGQRYKGHAYCMMKDTGPCGLHGSQPWPCFMSDAYTLDIQCKRFTACLSLLSAKCMCCMLCMYVSAGDCGDRRVALQHGHQHHDGIHQWSVQELGGVTTTQGHAGAGTRSMYRSFCSPSFSYICFSCTFETPSFVQCMRQIRVTSPFTCAVLFAVCLHLQEFLVLLSPYAPHLSEELWARAGNTTSIAYAPWPVADESLLVADSVKLPVQVSVADRSMEVPVLLSLSAAA